MKKVIRDYSNSIRAIREKLPRRRRAGLALSEHSESKGFTFVELIMYMGILVFVLLILTQILSSILEVRLESEAASTVHQDGRFILSKLTRDINRAESIVLPATPSAQTDSLALTIDSISHTYSLLNNNIMITNNIGSNNLNSYETTVSNLSFKRLGNVGGKNTITASFTLTSEAERN